MSTLVYCLRPREATKIVYNKWLEMGGWRNKINIQDCASRQDTKLKSENIFRRKNKSGSEVWERTSWRPSVGKCTKCPLYRQNLQPPMQMHRGNDVTTTTALLLIKPHSKLFKQCNQNTVSYPRLKQLSFPTFVRIQPRHRLSHIGISA